MSGIPFTVTELLGASKQPMDVYHRDLMEWAAKEIERLKELLKDHAISS